MNKKILLLSVFVSLFFPLFSYASIYGVLHGKVVDSEGKGVIGATVLVRGTTRGVNVRDKNGEFTITNIVAGEYEIEFRAVGKRSVIKKVRLSADETTDVSAVLEDEAVMKETVVITAERQLVSKDAIGKQTTFVGDEITSTSREGINSIVSLSAGVRDAGDGFNIRGARTSETQIRVDGMDITNRFTGDMGLGGTRFYPMVSAYAVEEVQVLTGGFSAEYGESQGGVVNNVLKTGRTDRYEGFFRYRTDVPGLWGRQANGLNIIRQDTKLVPVLGGEGAKLQGPGLNSFDVGIGGPLPLPIFKNSTFYLSAKSETDKYRNSGYEIYDPAGNNLGQLDNQRSWIKNISLRLRFQATNDIGLILGTEYGIASHELGGWGWLYADDQGIIDGKPNGVSESFAKQYVGNQYNYKFLARINHTLTSSSFYDFTISYNVNTDQIGRRNNFDDPSFFSGFDIMKPQDEYVLNGTTLVKGTMQDGRIVGDKILDQFTSWTSLQYTKDGYLLGDIPVINPLTGYFEGNAYTGTNNPYGVQGIFASHGNQGGLQFRDQFYWQVDGNYTNSFKTGSEFSHLFKTGFQLQLFELDRHYNLMPWDGNPFFDLFTDKYGGNIYADNKDIYDKTSKPFKPTQFAFYAQDKISYKGIIFTPGLRLDLFAPNSQYRLPSQTFTSIRSDTGFADASIKYQISPRINIAYPITDKSVLSLSYGLYFKTPSYQYLYDNFAVDVLRGNNLIGNPNMESQRTNEYQVSFNQQIGDNMSMGVTTYYKDMYNQLGLTYVPSIPTPYYQYSVAEFGNSRGVEVEFRKNPSNDHIALVLNYTLSYVNGTAPDPSSNYMVSYDPYSDRLAFPLAPFPQPWDIRHYLKGYLTFVWGDNEGPSIFKIQPLENAQINFTGTYRSGYPYTKTDRNGTPIGETNAERQPSYWNIDSRISKELYLRDIFGKGAGNSSIEIFIDIYNILNIRSVTRVFSATGDPIDNGVTLERQIGDFSGVTWYKDASYGNTATFKSDQYDIYGNRFYNANADIDQNGTVTQAEKYEAYMRYAKDAMSSLGNYKAPRTIYIGFMFKF
ncbi:MAG TPA: hypothetical protein DCW42_08770 [Bacteroidetes bacterium]|nr:hypothetical protein [Bacteroidota bacterium]